MKRFCIILSLFIIVMVTLSVTCNREHIKMSDKIYQHQQIQTSESARMKLLHAAEKGDLDAQYQLACYYERGHGFPEDHTIAFTWYHKAAEQGHLEAQRILWRSYRFGQKVEKDLAETARWGLQMAEQGDIDAQIYMGRCYQYGDGVTKDYTEAIKWYRKAAEQGDESAQSALKRLEKRMQSENEKIKQ